MLQPEALLVLQIGMRDESTRGKSHADSNSNEAIQDCGSFTGSVFGCARFSAPVASQPNSANRIGRRNRRVPAGGRGGSKSRWRACPCADLHASSGCAQKL